MRASSTAAGYRARTCPCTDTGTSSTSRSCSPERGPGGARGALRRKALRFRMRLAELGLDTGGSSTQIVPVRVGEPERALALSAELEERGVLCVAIRPPTVPPRTSRLRFSLMATHDDADLEQALNAVADATPG